MFETWLRREGAATRVEITWSTFEQSYIQAFGPRLHEVVSAEFAERGIEGHTGEVVTEVAAGEARYADGTTRALRPAGRLPALRRRRPLRRPAVRRARLHRDRPRDPAGRRPARHLRPRRRRRLPGQAGVPRLPAGRRGRRAHRGRVAGATRSSSPSTRSACASWRCSTRRPSPRCPLELTGDPARPVAVRPDADGDYKVGTSPRGGSARRCSASTVPMRFHAGEPFHAGLGWQMMEVGLKGMSAVLAD